MSFIAQNIENIKKQLPNHVRLVAVSKFNPAESIIEAYRVGQRIFGESQAQELVPKSQQLPPDIEWHFIGHLQTNKVKYIIPIVSLIHGVDSLKLMQEINKQALKNKRVINCLLHIRIAQEDTKHGLSFDEAEDLVQRYFSNEFSAIKLCGIMGMATDTDNQQQVEKEFKQLAGYFSILKQRYFTDDPLFSEISMGMTHDFWVAVEEGANSVRLGTALFGEREYSPAK